MEHLAELLLKLLILFIEAYNLYKYKLEKTLKALIETRNLDQRPQNQLKEADKNDLSDK